MRQSPTDPTRRLDTTLVRRGLARSRAEARQLVRHGGVLLDGAAATRASQPVREDADVRLGTAAEPWVSRAAYKLIGGLDKFGELGLRVAGRRSLDVGASTGGFSQVLLARGVKCVIALDVGHGQLAAELATDPRVQERSGRNVRDVTPEELGGAADLVVADLSFISLVMVLPILRSLTAVDGDLVVLVKPQFEVGRERLGKGGVVRKAEDRRQALTGVLDVAAAEGLAVHGMTPSPIRGAYGNAEYLVWCSPRHHGAMRPEEVTRRVAEVVGEAAG